MVGRHRAFRLFFSLCIALYFLSVTFWYRGADRGFINASRSIEDAPLQFHYIGTLHRGSFSIERFEEMVVTAQHNLDNKHIQSVHLFVEEGMDPMRYLDSPKLSYTVNSEPLYEDLFNVANRYSGDGLGIIVGNADVEFGETLACVMREQLDNTVMALSRHPNKECGDTFRRGDTDLNVNKCTMYQHSSHDSYIYFPPMKESIIAEMDHPQSALGSEVKVIKTLRDNGIVVTNPCLSVITTHNHCTGERNYADPVMWGNDISLHVIPTTLPNCPTQLEIHPDSLYHPLNKDALMDAKKSLQATPAQTGERGEGEPKGEPEKDEGGPVQPSSRDNDKEGGGARDHDETIDGHSTKAESIDRSGPPPLRFHYISTLYRGTYTTARFEEILMTVQHNLDNPFIQSVHLLVEEGLDPLRYLDSPKLSYTVNSDPLYKDFLEAANEYSGDGLGVIVGNADVEFGETLGCVTREQLDNTVMVLSRHPNGECGDMLTRRSDAGVAQVDVNKCTVYPHPSHDSYIYFPPLEEAIIAELDHPQHALGSEVKVIKTLRDNGIVVTNPCLSVITTHNHCTGERNYAVDRVMWGKDISLHVIPSTLPNCPTQLEMHPDSLYHPLNKDALMDATAKKGKKARKKRDKKTGRGNKNKLSLGGGG